MLPAVYLPPLQHFSKGIFFLSEMLVVCFQTFSSFVIWELPELQACFLHSIVVAVNGTQQLIFELAKYSSEGTRYGAELSQNLR